jgi:hypothetical protein
MGQFGVKMNLIWIIQVSEFISKLKTIFWIVLSLLFNDWTWDTILRKTRGYFVYFSKTHTHPARGWRVDCVKVQGLFRKTARIEGVCQDPSHWIRNRGLGLNRPNTEPVGFLVHQIEDPRCRFQIHAITSPPLDTRRTTQTTTSKQ